MGHQCSKRALAASLLATFGAVLGCETFTGPGAASDAGGADSSSSGAPEAGVLDGAVAADGGRPFRLVFLSSEGKDGAFGGMLVADALCLRLAQLSPIKLLHERHWVALLSDGSTHAAARVPLRAPVDYRLPTGPLVFAAGSEIFRGPQVALSVDDLGKEHPELVQVWTGTDTGGVSSSSHCSSWRDKVIRSGTTGWATGPRAIDQWLTATTGAADCESEHPFYCVETE